MKCEFCNKELVEIYGSGRFCNKKCASAFSTKAKRQYINDIVSFKLTGRSNIHLQNEEIREKRNSTMMKKYGTVGFSQTDREKALECFRQKCYNERHSGNFSNFSTKVKKKILVEKFGHKCSECKLELWLGKSIPLEIDHVDGNHDNNEESNFRLLCPNCHAFTPTYRKKKK